MRRGSTPTNTFEVDVDLTGATVFVSYEQQGKAVYTLDLPDGLTLFD